MFREYITLLLLGHILGDFYLQTNGIAEKKKKNIKWVLLHGLFYWIVMLLVVIPFISIEIVLAATAASLLHIIVDIIKYIYLSIAKKNSNAQVIERNMFFIDQIVHLLCLILISYVIADSSYILHKWAGVKHFFSIIGIQEMPLLSWILALLLVHKPTNISIQKLLVTYRPQVNVNNKSDNNAGRLIGTIERIIMLIFLSMGQYSAIGLVLTAKSIARYDKISKEKNFAEYYLLGTLISTVAVIVVSLLVK